MAIAADKRVNNGEKVGKHRGIPFYTVGQRKGLGLAMGKPVYVKKIDHNNNVVEIADKDELLENLVYASDINYVSRPLLKKGEIVVGKIRYSDKGTPAEVVESTPEKIIVNFLEPKNAVTPGQSLVIYDEMGYVLCGGIIEKGQE